MKISANAYCPCGSEKKYKHCCRVFHKGEKAKNALELMRSRYSAFASNEFSYIINTTHKDNPDFTYDTKSWQEDIKSFTQSSDFKKLEILDFTDGENEAYVTFKATIFQAISDVSFIERSKFLKQNKQWLYHSGKFLQG